MRQHFPIGITALFRELDRPQTTLQALTPPELVALDVSCISQRALLQSCVVLTTGDIEGAFEGLVRGVVVDSSQL